MGPHPTLQHCNKHNSIIKVPSRLELIMNVNANYLHLRVLYAHAHYKASP